MTNMGTRFKKAVTLLFTSYMLCFCMSIIASVRAEEKTPVPPEKPSIGISAPTGLIIKAVRPHDAKIKPGAKDTEFPKENDQKGPKSLKMNDGEEATRHSSLNPEDVLTRILSLLETPGHERSGPSLPSLHCDAKQLIDVYAIESQSPNPILKWIHEKGINENAEIFIGLIASAVYQGLDPATYHLPEIISLYGPKHGHPGELEEAHPAPLTIDRAARLEILLTDAFFTYGQHLSQGRIDPLGYDFNWHIAKQEHDPDRIYEALCRENMQGFIEMLEPKHPGYAKLKGAMIRYREISAAGGWQTIADGPKLEAGDQDPRVIAIKQRLGVTGDLAVADNTKDALFDGALEEAVKQFQFRNGLTSDGVVGKNTIAALNIPAEELVRRIGLNMERWRWLPASLGESYIMVNAAGFEVSLVENEHVVKSIKAIVGKKSRPTPILSERIKYMEINPYWNIPHAIAVKDMLPRVHKDPGYFRNHRIQVFENWQNGAKEINPADIDWTKMNKRNFSYKLRQKPMEDNALGQIKFMFPNPFAVYMHDTNAHALFNKDRRAFSSGCVRIEKPVALAAYLLKDKPGWDSETIEKVLDSKKTKIIALSKPANIHILYWTAWVDAEGRVHFRDDIYGKDQKLNIALNHAAADFQVAQAALKGKKS